MLFFLTLVDWKKCLWIELDAFSREKVHVTVGARLFGFDNEGITAMINGTAWSARLENNLKEIMFKASYTDPNIWSKPDIKSDGTSYYTYYQVYVDDILIVSENPKQFMDQLDEMFQLKDGSG